jgi:hypothetical protein
MTEFPARAGRVKRVVACAAADRSRVSRFATDIACSIPNSPKVEVGPERDPRKLRISPL